MRLSISSGNTKLGRIYNISLPPGVSCQKGVPCAGLCYAKKAWRRSSVRRAWGGNYRAWKQDPMGYFESIAKFCIDHKVERFRWHVAGDIPTLAYLAGMELVAKCLSETQFLAFTKNKEVMLKNSPPPPNLKLVFSMWPGLLTDKDPSLEHFMSYGPVAWMVPQQANANPTLDAYDRIRSHHASESIECTGRCDSCFLCWYLEPGMSVAFKQH